MNLETIHYRITQLEVLLKEHTEQDNRNFGKLHETMTDARIDIQGLKSSARVWGGAAGLVVSAIATAAAAYFFTLLPH